MPEGVADVLWSRAGPGQLWHVCSNPGAAVLESLAECRVAGQQPFIKPFTLAIHDNPSGCKSFTVEANALHIENHEQFSH
jgi:hypothetical protein